MKRVIETCTVAHACLLLAVGVIATSLVGCSSKSGDSGAYCARGIAYAAKGKHDRAVADFTEAIRLQPDNADAYYNRGNAYTEKDEHDRAIADYSEAIRLQSGYAQAYCNRGIAYAAKGEHDQAIADYTEAIRLQSDSDAAKDEHDQAIADHSKGIRLQRDSADAHYNRGTTYGTRVSSSSQPSMQWLEGGNLHNATITRWKTATAQNKLATVADWLVATKWEGHLKSLNDFDKLKLTAQRVVSGLDTVVTDVQSDSVQMKEIAAVLIVVSNDIGP